MRAMMENFDETDDTTDSEICDRYVNKRDNVNDDAVFDGHTQQ